MATRWQDRTFTIASMLTAALYFYLFAGLLLAPASILTDLGAVVDASVTMLAHRVSALMLGFAVLLFLVRHARPSPLRRAVAFAVGVNMAGFAVSTLHQLLRGAAAPSVWAVAVIELVISATFLWFAALDLRQPSESAGAAGGLGS